MYKKNNNDPDVYSHYMHYIRANLKNLETKNRLNILIEGMKEATSLADEWKLIKCILVYIKRRILRH